MDPFSFIITLLSFIYSLALTHLLYGVARLVRHRRTITVSPAHLVWVANIFFVLILNWIALWDFSSLKTLTLAAISAAVLFAVLLYLVATFVTADVEVLEQRDLRDFHRRESVTYIGGLLTGAVISLALNLGANNLGVSNWAAQNGLLIAGFLPLVVALFVREGWIHLMCAALCLATTFGFLILYYPTLS